MGEDKVIVWKQVTILLSAYLTILVGVYGIEVLVSQIAMYKFYFANPSFFIFIFMNG